MIVAGQVQHAVKNQDTQLVGARVPVAGGVQAGDIGGDGDLTAFLGGSREGKYVGGVVFASEVAIQLLQAPVPGDQNVNFTIDSGELLRAPGESRQACRAHTFQSSL